MKLIIQIPCYNEAKTLTVTLNELPKRIAGVDEIEYLVIDDGSTDDTIEVARKWGLHHIVKLKRNKGLAFSFLAGLDACLRLGADIIVNTDADNQYRGQDIPQLIQPILDGKSDIVIGERPIDQTKHFSPIKKKLQHLGSWVVQKASDSDIPDAPSGFRAFSREAAMRLNVTNKYTYTLETIIQAGRTKIPQTSVPIHTNAELRPSRLFKSIPKYLQKTSVLILRTYLMYSPLKTFTFIAFVPLLIGFALGARYVYFMFQNDGSGHTQSLILCSICLIIGFLNLIIGLLADLIAKNRLLLEDIQYHVRKLDYDFYSQYLSLSKTKNNRQKKS